MTRATELFPILLTHHLDRAVAFYRDVLGGTVTFSYPAEASEPLYVALELGQSHLGIGLDESVESAPQPRAISLWAYTDDCDGLVERARAAGAPVTQEPADQPWGERVGRVLDPDGNELMIGQRLREPNAERAT